jgi:secondary thiamine-phosphate synthase enzyme
MTKLAGSFPRHSDFVIKSSSVIRHLPGAVACENSCVNLLTKNLTITTTGKGTYEITDKIEAIVRESKVGNGVVTVFTQHTSCSLIVMENADPTARRDLEEFFNRLVPENADYFEHDAEGSDDMPSHIRMVLTRTSETIPIVDGRMQLGTWQGIFLFEHRRASHRRNVLVTVMGV